MREDSAVIQKYLLSALPSQTSAHEGRLLGLEPESYLSK